MAIFQFTSFLSSFKRSFSSKFQFQELKNEFLIRKFPLVRLIDRTSGKLMEPQRSDQILLTKPENSDLIIMDGRQEPPIVRFQSHSEAFKSSQQRVEAATKARLANKFKEMHLTTVTGDHDFSVKLGKVLEWLRKGWRVKMVIEEKKRNSKGLLVKPTDEKKEMMNQIVGKLGDVAEIVGVPETERGCLIFTLHANQKILSQLKQERSK